MKRFLRIGAIGALVLTFGLNGLAFVASYPTSVVTFTTKTAGDVIQPAHINALQDEIVAIENDLLTAFPGGGAVGGQFAFPATQNASANANTLDDYEEGSFTGTLTGVSGTVTATIRYTKIGNHVTLDAPQLSGTSTTTAKTLTGMPAALHPALEKSFVYLASDNGGAIVTARVTIATNGVITLYPNAAAGSWTAAGTALIPSFSLSYTLA